MNAMNCLTKNGTPKSGYILTYKDSQILDIEKKGDRYLVTTSHEGGVDEGWDIDDILFKKIKIYKQVK